MYFPRYHGTAKAQENDADEAVIEGDTGTILVVEDDAELRAYITDVLRHLNLARAVGVQRAGRTHCASAG